MKKILFLLTLVLANSTFLQAKSCMTDIYFGNGVWNTEEQGQEGRDELKFFMQYRADSRLDIQKEGIDYDFKHAYNYGTGKYTDLIETFYQLKESGQIDEGYFQMIAATLATKDGANSHQEVMDEIQNIIKYYNYNASRMYEIYQQSSFSKKHNVLLVAHSQGNLFGNKMYTLMSKAQKKKFRMVSVATPANHVAGYANGGPYVTATGDYVIRPIPGSLPSNIAGIGHTFLGTYLNVLGEGSPGDGSDNAPKIIALHVKSAYDNLMQTTSCTQYAFVKVLMPSFASLKIIGMPEDAYHYEDVGSMVLPVTDAIKVYNNQGEIVGYRCKSNVTTLYDSTGGSGDNWGLYNDGNISNSKLIEWLPGRIHNLQELESRISVKEELIHPSKQCTTISLGNDKKLFSLLKDTFSTQ